MAVTHDFDEETERLLLVDSSEVENVQVVPRNDFAQGSLATHLVTALEASTHVKWISIHLACFDVPGEDPSNLLHYLRNLGNRNHSWVGIIFVGPSNAAVLSQFLRATQQNQYRRFLVCLLFFPNLQLAHLKLLPRDASIFNCGLADEDVALEEVEDALNANSTVKYLALHASNANTVTLAHKILRALHAHPSLLCLNLTGIDAAASHRVSESLATLIRTLTGPLYHMEFAFIEMSAHFLSEIAAANKSAGQRVVVFGFRKCTFDEDSFESLKSIFDSDDATQGKEMQCYFHHNSFSFNQYELAVRDLMASAPGLFVVEVDSETAHEDGTLVKGIMQGLTSTSSKVRTLKLPLLSPELCQTLAECLPKYRNLRELEVNLESDDQMSSLLRSALRGNSSVITAQVSGLAPEDAAHVDWYCTRNEKLPGLKRRHAQPDGVLAMIPHLFALSPNPTDVFRGLSVLGSSVGPGQFALQHHHEPINVVVATQPQNNMDLKKIMKALLLLVCCMACVLAFVPQQQRTSQGLKVIGWLFPGMLGANDEETTDTVFWDTKIDGKDTGSIAMEFYRSMVPKTAQNIEQFCTEEPGFGFKSSSFHFLLPGQQKMLDRGDGDTKD